MRSLSESLARAKWPNQDPIGRFIQFGNMDGDIRGLRIVGVAGDVREISPEATPPPLIYTHYRQRQNAPTQFSVIVRGPRPGSIAAGVPSRAVYDAAGLNNRVLTYCNGAPTTSIHQGRRYRCM